MARGKKENNESIRQTEYRTKKNDAKREKSKIDDNNVKENSVEKIDKEIQDPMEKELSTEFVEKKSYNVDNKKSSHAFVNFFLCIILLVGLCFFLLNLYLNKNNIDILNIISSLFLILFTIFFVTIGFKSRKKSIVFLAALLLGSYFSLGIYSNLANSNRPINIINSGVKDFTGKSLTEVVKWAEKNKITLKQEYEYSDMIEEYEIINQSIKAGTNINDVKELTVVISEGPNPSKEIIVPDMISWDDERVINFVEENYLSNVDVEFVQSDKAVDTVIEQSKAGNLKRNEELKITFSYGEELGYDEVKIIDFTKKTEFEVMFYMKQHHLNYEFSREFSNKIKRNLAMKQDKEPGTSVKINDEKIKVTFSKGKEIEVPNLTNMSMSEITTWIITNRLKLEFSDKYDEKVKANNVISANYKKGDKIEQGETIKVVISKGSLKMPKFSSYEEFRTWADKYEIKYEEKHEFNSSVNAGEVISYSYKTGDTIKNDDVIIVTISDGEAIKVPDLDGLTKSQVISKLDKLGLKYSFVYSYSNTVKEGLVIKQSISAGSEISKNITITVTLSNGKKKTSSGSTTGTTNKDNNTNSGSNNSDNNEPTCVSKTIKITRELNTIFNNNNGYDAVRSALINYFNSLNVKINVVKVTGDAAGGASSGSYIGGIGPGDEVKSCNSIPYTIEVAG